MYRIALCDDAKLQLDIINDHLYEIAEDYSLDIKIDLFSSGERLVSSYNQGNRFDIIFLDIQMEAMDGLETAERIRVLDSQVIILFLTGYTEYLQKGYEVQAFRYLIKPITKDKIQKAFLAAISQIQTKKRGSYLATCKGEDIKILLDDIYYFEAKDHMVYIYEERNETQIRARLMDIEEELSSKGFVRCHKGYLVNVHRIRRFSSRDLTLDNGSVIPVSRSCIKKSKEAFLLTMR